MKGIATMKKIFKSSTDKKICGVCGGIAKYLSIDATVIRLLWVIITALGGAGVVAYIICAIIMPDEPPVDSYREAQYTDINNDGENN